MKHFDDIHDDEIRIIGQQEVKREPFYKALWFWAAIAAATLLLALSILLAIRSSTRHSQKGTVEEVTIVEEQPESAHPYVVECEPASVLVCDTVINDVPLRLRTPVNALPELIVGFPDSTDKSLILALQAADIRADNHGIVGAFVCKGELLSRGVAKKGFCAIIDQSIRIGMAESTPLFEEAINKEGYFFRQYPLVENGRMIENKPKNKSLRHALCVLNGQVVTVSCLDKESLHDFAQALADLGVESAIYLVGGDAYGFCHSQPDGTAEGWGNIPKGKKFENVNFIVWRIPE